MDYEQIPLTQILEITHIISLHYLKMPRNFSFKGESHDFWELIYIDQGQVLVSAGNSRYLLKAGELGFHKPNEFHGVHAYKNTTANVIVAAFVSTSACMKHFVHRFTALSAQERKYLYEIISLRYSIPNLITERQTLPSGPPPVCRKATVYDIQVVRANLELLLLTLLNRRESQRIQHRIESYAQLTVASQISKQIKEYLHTHIGENLTLDRISNDLGYSVSQMRKLFRRDMNQSIIDYFIRLKTSEAKRMLHTGDLNVTQVAEALGYNSLSYFCRQFKQYENMTPAECCNSFLDAGK